MQRFTMIVSVLTIWACGPETDGPKVSTTTNNANTTVVTTTGTNNSVAPTNNATSNGNNTTSTTATNNSTTTPTNNSTANPTNNQTNNQTIGPAPSGPDTMEPFPIDRGDDPGTPGTYKGLPLRLTDTGAPVVQPVGGTIGVVCIGMSNSNQECGDFIQKLAGGLDADVAAGVVWVNCAVGGNAIERWNDPALDANLWDACINQKLGQAGISLNEVRVVYHKAANQFTSTNGQPLPPYPARDSDYFNFYTNLTTFAGRVSQKFRNLQAVYTTSRSYGGFSSNAGRGEPLSYEEGHALNAWLVDNSNVDGVWHGWGPYIWAPDCASGENNGSGVCYVRDDYQADGVHPATGARDKISALIHARFLMESWYAR